MSLKSWLQHESDEENDTDETGFLSQRISNPGYADRLAWTVLEGISLYLEEEVNEAVQEGRFYARMGEELNAGFLLYQTRIDPTLDARAIFYEAVSIWQLALYKRAGRVIPENDVLVENS